MLNYREILFVTNRLLLPFGKKCKLSDSHAKRVDKILFKFSILRIYSEFDLFTHIDGEINRKHTRNCVKPFEGISRN